MKKNLYKAALLAALGLGGIAAAQAATPMSGDLVIGFTSTTVGTQNYIIDLGQFSGMGVNDSLGSLLDATTLQSIFGNDLTGVSVGIVGQTGGGTLYQTTTRNSGPFSVPYNLADSTTPTAPAFNGFINAAASDVASLNVGGAFSRGTGANMVAGDWNGNIAQDAATAGYATADWTDEVGNPMGSLVSDGNGGYSINLDLYQDSAGSSATRQFQYDGYFNLDIVGNSVSLTYNPTAVPEPTVCGLLGGAGLLLLGLRRKFTSHKTV